MTDPCVLISRPIPDDQRRRVYVAGYGSGWQQHSITLRGVLFGIGVMLDSGEYQTFSPHQVSTPPPVLHRVTGNVVPFPVRARAT